MNIKVHRNYYSIVVTISWLLIISTSTSVISYLIFGINGQAVGLISIGFLIIGSMLFEFQKNTLAKSLATKVSSQNTVHIIIYNNGYISDFFENFLIIDRAAITICTYYHPMQKTLNRFINKPLSLRTIRISDLEKYSINGNALHLFVQGDEIVLTNIPEIAAATEILDQGA